MSNDQESSNGIASLGADPKLMVITDPTPPPAHVREAIAEAAKGVANAKDAPFAVTVEVTTKVRFQDMELGKETSCMRYITFVTAPGDDLKRMYEPLVDDLRERIDDLVRRMVEIGLRDRAGEKPVLITVPRPIARMLGESDESFSARVKENCFKVDESQP